MPTDDNLENLEDPDKLENIDFLCVRFLLRVHKDLRFTYFQEIKDFKDFEIVAIFKIW